MIRGDYKFNTANEYFTHADFAERYVVRLAENNMIQSHWPNKRYEYKYLLRPGTEDKIGRAFAPYVVRDPHLAAHTTRYLVRSVYFDTPRLDYYHEKMAGNRIRKKVRVRTYGLPHKSAFLEIKRRIDAWGYKERCKIDLSALSQALSSRDPSVPLHPLSADERRVLSRVCQILEAESIRPTISVECDREPLMGVDSPGTRITFDSDVRCRPVSTIDELFVPSGYKHIDLRNTILECKFDSCMPSWMLKTLQRFELQSRAVSKYCHSIDAWHSVTA